MSNFDLRYTIPIFINLLKFQSEALLWDFDAFHVINNLHQTSWTKISFHVSLLLLISFTSMTISLTRLPPNSTLIRFQLEKFSPHIAVSLLASLFFPQTLFWFLYPSILILNHLLGRVNVRLSALPSWNFGISSTLTYDYHHQEDDIDIAAHAAPVDEDAVDHISPEDNDENMEALTTASITGSQYGG